MFINGIILKSNMLRILPLFKRDPRELVLTEQMHLSNKKQLRLFIERGSFSYHALFLKHYEHLTEAAVRYCLFIKFSASDNAFLAF